MADNLPPYCAVVKKSRSLNFLDPPVPPMACYGSALPLVVGRHDVCGTAGCIMTTVVHLLCYECTRGNDGRTMDRTETK